MPRFPSACLAAGLVLAAAALAAAAAMPPHHPQRHAPRALMDRIARSNPASLTGAEPGLPGSGPARRPFSPGLRVTPSSFGADPTGRKDSWAALNQCLQHCLNQSTLSPNGYFPGQDTTPSFGPIRDMGGCDIDLEGGECVLGRSPCVGLARVPSLAPHYTRHR